MCGVFREGRMPSRKIPPAPRTRCNAPGSKAGCAFFAPGFFAQAKKGGSRRHGAKAFDLCVAARQEGEQEQLAALAPPSSGAARHLLPQAGEGLPHPGLRAPRHLAPPPALRSAQGVQACASQWLASSTPYPRKRATSIGRASCRARVCQYVQLSAVRGSLKIKKSQLATDQQSIR